MTSLNTPQDENSEPGPVADERVDPPVSHPTGGQPWALILAIIWAVAAIIVGLVFVLGVNGENAEAYAGDTYPGIEAAIIAAVHAVGWVIISTGVLGVIIAGSRDSTTK